MCCLEFGSVRNTIGPMSHDVESTQPSRTMYLNFNAIFIVYEVNCGNLC